MSAAILPILVDILIRELVFTRPAADGNIPPTLTPPPTIIPKPDDQPTIVEPPRVIYVPTGGGGAKPEVNINVKAPPTVPPRRLPREADGQSPTKTPKKHSISIKTALYDEIHGELLTFPLTQKKAVFTRYELDGFAIKMKATLESGANAFGIWLAHERGDEVDEGTAEPTLFDGTALITPSNLAGLSGAVGLIYGVAPLTTLASAYQVSRANALQPVTGYVPLQIEIKSKPIPDPTPSFLSSQSFIFSGGLAEVKKVLGVSEFPVTVPRSLVQHTDAELDKLLEKKIQLMRQELGKIGDPKLKKAMQEAIKDAEAEKVGKSVYQSLDNIPQQISWSIKVLDEVLGSYPVNITLKDSNLIKVGEQEQKLTLPNIAESLAELTGFAVINHSATELAVNMLMRVLAETGTGRMQSIKNYYLLDVLRDYLGVPTNDKTVLVPFTYDPLFTTKDAPEEDEFAKFLTASLVEVDIEEISGNTNLQKDFSTIEKIYALCKAYMTKPVKNKEDIVQYIKNIAGAFPGNNGDNDVEDDFDQFLDKIEQGFVAEPGNTMDNKPYGREFGQRPKITRLTKQNKGAG